jgi:hypothetical protein
MPARLQAGGHGVDAYLRRQIEEAQNVTPAEMVSALPSSVSGLTPRYVLG